ncbi:25ac14c8-bfcb-417a-937f-432641856187-CDS [Sclerotinia trifoliorum]|uniref:Carboxylic ester hydrolase n=1 Tax=Sclerotinia trifoliorum TaxID=28548 RepID=A0A8H2W3H9_9HELO|nr:25ac14c8-bfcb-417a-937f-432641856187-CDS [Sclerotinia trifoliorum]
MSTSCSLSTIPYPYIPGTSFLSITSTPLTNFTIATSQTDSHFASTLSSLNFCNITLTYTHPGENDTINVKIFLPTQETWNGRFIGTGGGGYATGGFDSSLAEAVSQGYAAAGTDGGHYSDGSGIGTAAFPTEGWALLPSGNINLYLLQDFASVALDEMTNIGKQVATSYYGRKPEYAYWNGCSTGGRQGLMMAQRYPLGYNGILAAAPAINWVKFIVAEYWAQFVMNTLGVYSSPCEFDGITSAAVEACDAIDGVVDGILSMPGLCKFQANETIGKDFTCADGSSVTISEAATKVAQAAWDGPRTSEGKFLWYGINRSGNLSALAGTTCTDGNTNCTGTPFQIPVDWINLFIEKNATFPLQNITHQQFERIFHASIQQFTSIIGTSDADLSEFRDAGGKLISWHGLADQLIFPNGTSTYYEEVQELDENVRDYYRYFEAPGVGHCAGGNGPFPYEAFDALVSWVEKGEAPEVLKAKSLPGVNGTVIERNLCLYPLVSKYVGGDPMVASSFKCR